MHFLHHPLRHLILHTPQPLSLRIHTSPARIMLLCARLQLRLSCIHSSLCDQQIPERVFLIRPTYTLSLMSEHAYNSCLRTLSSTNLSAQRLVGIFHTRPLYHPLLTFYHANNIIRTPPTVASTTHTTRHLPIQFTPPLRAGAVTGPWRRARSGCAEAAGEIRDRAGRVGTVRGRGGYLGRQWGGSAACGVVGRVEGLVRVVK